MSWCHFKKYFYLFLERGEGKEKERERNTNVWLPLTCPPTGDLARNPDMCPDRELNPQPFGLQACTQSTELHQPGPFFFFLRLSFLGASQIFESVVSCFFFPNLGHLQTKYLFFEYFFRPTFFPLSF